jgi:predicted methyltransferase
VVINQAVQELDYGISKSGNPRFNQIQRSLIDQIQFPLEESLGEAYDHFIENPPEDVENVKSFVLRKFEAKTEKLLAENSGYSEEDAKLYVLDKKALGIKKNLFYGMAVKDSHTLKKIHIENKKNMPLSKAKKMEKRG